MKIRSFITCIIVVNASMAVLSIPTNILPAQAGLVNDSPINGIAPVPEDYQIDVLSGEFAVVGVRPESGDDFDVEVYTDTSYSTIIDSSTTSGDSVDFVALEKDIWTSPPARGVRITKGTTSYTIEMENEIESHPTSDTWSGSMDAVLGNPVLDLGPSGSWDDVYVSGPTVLYDGVNYHMWYCGFDGSRIRIGYATSDNGIIWTKNPSNPVLEEGIVSSWDENMVTQPTVIYDGSMYHMWYAGGSGTKIRIGYASSINGILWIKNPANPVLIEGIAGSWDDYYVHTPEVIFDGSIFHMWYLGHDGVNGRIGYAMSSDGITWTKSTSNPVIDLGPPGSWEDIHIGSPTVVFDGTTFHMWYSGDDGNNVREGYATSQDKISWIKNPLNPVLDIGPPGSWESDSVGVSSVLYDGQTLHKWYAGKQGPTYRIGYATLPDMDNWEKYSGNPVLDIGTGGQWDDMFVRNPSILFDGTTYHMWYSGNGGPSWKIGYANSTDGINWNKYIGNPVMDVGSAWWEDAGVLHPSVLFDGVTYHMWYSGDDGSTTRRIGYANSTDGINWNRYSGNPVINLGTSGMWDDDSVYASTVIYDGSIYHMWYFGRDSTNRHRIGYATSPDGISWTKYAGNPILDLGPPGSWEDFHILTPSVIYDGSIYQMWYGGGDGSVIRIGYATSVDGINWQRYLGNPIIDIGPPSSFDNNRAYHLSVLFNGLTYHMWYTGHDGSTYRIGYASIPWKKLAPSVEVIDAFEITGFNGGVEYTIELNVPPTADLDMFLLDASGGRNDALTSSVNSGFGSDESITFTAPISGDYLLVITNENGGTGEYTIKPGGIPPVADAGDDQIVDEGEGFQFNGSSSYDPDGTIELYQWDFNIVVDSDGDGETANDIDAIGPNPSHVYGDDGNFIAALKVTDNQGMTNIDTCEITVLNVAPSIGMFGPFTVNEGFPLTISALTTDPGSDDLTFSWLLESGPSETTTYFNDGVGADPYPSPLGSYPFSATDIIEHTYGDNGIYFVGLSVTDDDGGESVYNTTVTVNNLAPSGGISEIFLGDEGSSISFSATGSDHGSDDLTFNWNWGDGTPDTISTHFNDGTGPDPAKSPDGTYPFNVFDLQEHIYGDNANYTVTLTISDDDLDEIIYSTLVSVENIAPTIIPFNITAVDENSPTVIAATATDPGSDDLTFIWELEFGPTISNVYYNDGIGSDPYPSPQGDYPFTANDTIEYTYGDNGEYLVTLMVEDDDGGLTTFTTTAIVTNVLPTIDINGGTSTFENNPITLGCFAQDHGSDDLIVTWDWGDGFSPSVSTTYFNDGIGPDPYPSPDINPMVLNDSQMHTYGDNGIFTVTITVEDDDGGIAVSIINVTVENVDPVIESFEAYTYVNVSLRVAGEKWHSVGVKLFEEGSEIWAATVTRYPGDPDEQVATIEGLRMDMTRSYTALIDYLPNDPGVNGNVWGGTPVWIIIDFEDGSEERIHHTFNVRQSDWDSDHWNHIDPWEVDMMGLLIGHTFEVSSHITDPGSDDLTIIFTYGSQTITKEYLNSPPSPDPYPSPEVNPRDIMDITQITYQGAGTLTISVEDDDGAGASQSMDL